MRKPICSVNLWDWVLIAPGISNREEAIQWIKAGCAWPEESPAFKADKVPPLVRRRISRLSSLGLQAALTLADDQEIDYGVFSSRHGELTRTVQLIQDILSGLDASPTAFSQSVHNTTSGLFTIITKRAIPVTSIAAGHDAFHEAMIDGHGYLNQHPDHTVLVLDFDEPMPPPYPREEPAHYAGHAVGLLLRAGQEWTCRGTRCAGTTVPDIPPSVDFLRAHVLGASRWESVSPRHRWKWTKTAG